MCFSLKFFRLISVFMFMDAFVPSGCEEGIPDLDLVFSVFIKTEWGRFGSEAHHRTLDVLQFPTVLPCKHTRTHSLSFSLPHTYWCQEKKSNLLALLCLLNRKSRTFKLCMCVCVSLIHWFYTCHWFHWCFLQYYCYKLKHLKLLAPVPAHTQDTHMHTHIHKTN